jgi:micrococcal nuclease
MNLAMRFLRLLLGVAALACLFAAGAEASRGPCIPGKAKPVCYHWMADVHSIGDGDTIKVNIDGDGNSVLKRIRVTGINAAELDVYSHTPENRRGDCHGVEAANRLQELVEAAGSRVRLSAQDPASRSGPRLRRMVSVWSNGQWVDLAQILLDEGHVLFHPNGNEWARNASYARSAQVASIAGLNYWDTDYCAAGPGQDAQLQMLVNWDADGADNGANTNGEWARIKNLGVSDVDLSGWKFKDSHLRWFTFPSGASLPAGGVVTVYVGRRPSWDSNTTSRFYWGEADPVFENVKPAKGVGDGGYLFDRHGDLRAWMMYPCRVSCTDPLAGQVIVTAQPKAPEKVHLKNVGTLPANLEGYVLENLPWNYVFPAGTVLLPGERLHVVVQGKPSNDTRLTRFWGKSRYILNDRGDEVSLRTQTNIRLDCYAWGVRRC